MADDVVFTEQGRYLHQITDKVALNSNLKTRTTQYHDKVPSTVQIGDNLQTRVQLVPIMQPMLNSSFVNENQPRKHARDFWETRFPFYSKPRIYSCDNHLEREYIQDTPTLLPRPDNTTDHTKQNVKDVKINIDNRELPRDGKHIENVLEQSTSKKGKIPTSNISIKTEKKSAVTKIDDYQVLKDEGVDHYRNNDIVIVTPSDYYEHKSEVDKKPVKEVRNNNQSDSKNKSYKEKSDSQSEEQLEEPLSDNSNTGQADTGQVDPSGRCRRGRNRNKNRHYSCKFCDKGYMTLGALKMHIRTHTLPCKCHICGKAFSRQWLLQGHIRTHTGERPYVCSYCGRAFADRSNLRAHIQTHLTGCGLECHACAKIFANSALLLKHHEIGCEAMLESRRKNET